MLVYEHASDAVPYGVLTGDALFIGDVGRPDLLASIGFTADELGRQLYDSIQHKLMRLPDDVRVFPAHGAGSACGKNLSTELQSTIGQQRLSNYACQPMSVGAFLDVVTAGAAGRAGVLRLRRHPEPEQPRRAPQRTGTSGADPARRRSRHEHGGASLVDTRDEP